MSLQEQYLQKTINPSRLKQFSEQNFSPYKPPKTPEVIWQNLSDKTKKMTFLKDFVANWSQEIQQNNILKTQDLLKINYPRFSDQTYQIATAFLDQNPQNKENPYILEILNYIQNQLEKNEPLQIRFTNCIKRDEYTDLVLNQMKTGNSDKIVNSKQLDCGVSVKGWKEISEIAETIKYPIELDVYLGDVDYVLESGGLLDYDQNMQIYTQRMQELKSQYQKIIEQFFSQSQFVTPKIQLWLEKYSIEKYRQAIANFRLEKLRQTDLEIYQKLIKSRKYDFETFWKTREKMQQIGYSDLEIDRYILSESDRQIGQYILESEEDGLLGWAESVSDINYAFYSGNPFLTNPKPTIILNTRKS